MNSKTLRHGAKAASVVAAATIAIGLFSNGAANADTFIPLQDGEITQTLIDGTVVTVRQTGNSATISPSMGATMLHRNVWASGTVDVSLEGDNAQGGSIDTGYVVGCQINFGGNAGGGANAGATWDDMGDGGGIAPPLDGGTDVFGGGMSIAPGQATKVSILDIEYANSYDEETHKSDFDFEGNSGGFTYSDETFGVSGCAGMAQARSYTTVEVSTDRVDSTVTLWGQPFSMG
ncbi:MspA family porin [Rhodococcus marinonascens]|uniref:MspA family porin n=1 Tax=Rhodococcus marinonascens TaxID=38311 RepID=UPI000934422B|nr:MspA family porin [Rhodococcus marinonascens]